MNLRNYLVGFGIFASLYGSHPTLWLFLRHALYWSTSVLCCIKHDHLENCYRPLSRCIPFSYLRYNKKCQLLGSLHGPIRHGIYSSWILTTLCTMGIGLSGSLNTQISFISTGAFLGSVRNNKSPRWKAGSMLPLSGCAALISQVVYGPITLTLPQNDNDGTLCVGDNSQSLPNHERGCCNCQNV